MKQVFYISQWEWNSHIQHHSKLDDLWTGFEVAEWNRIGHVAEVNFHDTVGHDGLFWQSQEYNSSFWTHSNQENMPAAIMLISALKKYCIAKGYNFD